MSGSGQIQHTSDLRFLFFFARMEGLTFHANIFLIYQENKGKISCKIFVVKYQPLFNIWEKYFKMLLTENVIHHAN